MNIVIISGNLTRDAELKITANSKSVLNFTIANSIGFGQNKSAQFFRCNLWGDRATKLAEHLTKGKGVIVTGEIQLREYEKDGEKKISPEIFVGNIEFMGGGKKQDADDDAPPLF